MKVQEHEGVLTNSGADITAEAEDKIRHYTEVRIGWFALCDAGPFKVAPLRTQISMRCRAQQKKIRPEFGLFFLNTEHEISCSQLNFFNF